MLTSAITINIVFERANKFYPKMLDKNFPEYQSSDHTINVASHNWIWDENFERNRICDINQHGHTDKLSCSSDQETMLLHTTLKFLDEIKVHSNIDKAWCSGSQHSVHHASAFSMHVLNSQTKLCWMRLSLLAIIYSRPKRLIILSNVT